MMNNNDGIFSLSGRIRSMKHAADGIIVMLKDQHAFWVHGVLTIVILSSAYFFRVSKTEWLFLIMAITLVWVVEALNSALEYLCDQVSLEFQPLIKKSKDVAAGAVFLSVIGAFIVVLIVFIPHISAAL